MTDKKTEFDKILLGLALVIFIFSFTLVTFRNVPDPDYWWHVQSGFWMLEHQKIISADYFSFTRAGSFWRNSAWLQEIVMGYIARSSGSDLSVFAYFAGVTSLGILALWSAIKQNILIKTTAVIFCLQIMLPTITGRPVMVSFLCFIVYLWILDRYRTEGKSNTLFVLPLAMIIWNNSHGGFAMGYALLSVFLVVPAGQCFMSWLGRKYPPIEPLTRLFRDNEPQPGYKTYLITMSLVSAFVVAATCVSPYGVENLVAPLKNFLVQKGSIDSFILEWESPNFHSPLLILFLGFLIVFAVGWMRGERKADWLDTLIAVGLLAATLMMQRNLLFAAPGMIYVATKYLPPLSFAGILDSSIGKKLSILIPPALLVFSLFYSFFIFQSLEDQSLFDEKVASMYPVEAVKTLQQLPSGNLFNSYNWGGFLIDKAPEIPVFVDGRTVMFEDEFITGTYGVIYDAGPDWRKLLKEWNIRYLLVETRAPVVNVAREIGWPVLYQDKTSTLIENPAWANSGK